MDRSGRFVNEQEKDFDHHGVDEEACVDDNEASASNLSVFSSRLESSTCLSLKEIDEDSNATE